LQKQAVVDVAVLLELRCAGFRRFLKQESGAGLDLAFEAHSPQRVLRDRALDRAEKTAQGQRGHDQRTHQHAVTPIS
jgi:hypothetical protein